jgi:deoxyribonuclease II
MTHAARSSVAATLLRAALLCLSLALLWGPPGGANAGDAPVPLLEKGHPVDWWFVFKFNAASFPHCGAGNREARVCRFGGVVQEDYTAYSQQFVYASSERDGHALKKGMGCLGDTITDPVGATFDQVYNNSYQYVIWNDQPYGDPKIAACTASQQNCGAPWGHSKGLLAWNETGAGFVLQVSTPSWPESGSKHAPRKDGNTLGCVSDNNVKLSQHFFALKLTKDDVLKVLKALQNASVVTTNDPQVMRTEGGPKDVGDLAHALGTLSHATAATSDTLSTGVLLFSKPSSMHVPPWQMVSSLLGGVDLRTVTFWNAPFIPTTTAHTPITCWDHSLSKKPGAVEIAATGQWDGKELGFKAGSNHAKVGVSKSGSKHYAIFGDLNQQGTISGDCAHGQNLRGGLFFVLDDKVFADSLAEMIDGDTASTTIPRIKKK